MPAPGNKSAGSASSEGDAADRAAFLQERSMRNPLHTTAALLVASVLATGCAIHADERQVGTAAGAAVGGTVGHVLSGGSALGTIGGAVAGAVLGGEVGDRSRKKKSRRDDDDDD